MSEGLTLDEATRIASKQRKTFAGSSESLL